MNQSGRYSVFGGITISATVGQLWATAQAFYMVDVLCYAVRRYRFYLFDLYDLCTN